jgi:multicomponent Na+:H+ antiporter subunit B
MLAARLLVAPAVVLGVYVVTHGHLNPGGGFQGGVILATAAFIALLGGRRLQVSRLLGKEVSEVAHSVGAGGFVAVGTATLGLGAAFLQNLMPLGTTGQLNAAGFIPIVNALVGLEVAAAFVLIVSEFLIEAESAPEKEEQS